MTAPEREALVKALLDEAADLRHAPSGDAKDEQHNYNWTDKPHRCLYDACALVERAVTALSASPAVTVTEEMVDCAYDAMVANNPEVQGGIGLEDLQCGLEAVLASPRKSERDAVLEEAARVAENMPYRVLCMWDRPGGPPGNGYAEITGQKIIADRIRALKSTTPQTGSQE